MLNYLEVLRLRGLTSDEAFHILEIVEAREHRSTIFCTQFDSKGWLARINSSTDGESPFVYDTPIVRFCN